LAAGDDGGVEACTAEDKGGAATRVEEDKGGKEDDDDDDDDDEIGCSEDTEGSANVVGRAAEEVIEGAVESSLEALVAE